MAGPAAEVHVTEAAVAAMPKRWVLTTPEDAVRSYLDWTSYAYRLGQSAVATSVMTPKQGVRVDAYCQFNIEKKRLIDQRLTSLTIGKVVAGSTSTVVPVKEEWSYSYLSTESGNKAIGGPYTASYDSTYTVVKNKKGLWVVDSLKATARGTVK
jgi:hypothetical protein